MLSKNIILGLLAIGLASQIKAQDIHFTQMNMQPLTLNPAFTGNFHGLWRAGAIYRNQWGSVTNPFITTGAFADGTIKSDLAGNDALAVGIQFYNDKSGEVNLTNNTVMGSVAYHKLLGKENNVSLSVGLQGGYSSKGVDVGKMRFATDFQNGQWVLNGSGISLLDNLNFFNFNAGMALGVKFSQNVGMQFGLASNNIAQPKQTFRRASNQVGLSRRYTSQLGFIIDAGRVSIMPLFFAQYQAQATELVAGSEFNIRIGGDIANPSVATALFLGAYYRHEDAIMYTMGLQTNGFRIGIGYDYNISKLNVASGGNGGYEIAIQYIKPDPLDFIGRIVFPCQRF